MVYRFDLRTRASALKDPLTVEWIIPVEGAGGRTFIGASGRTNFALPFGKPVTLETAPVTMLGHLIGPNWIAPNGPPIAFSPRMVNAVARRHCGNRADQLRACCCSAASANTSAVIASTIGTARGTTHGS